MMRQAAHHYCTNHSFCAKTKKNQVKYLELIQYFCIFAHY